MSFYRGPVTHPVHQVIRLSYWPGSSVSQQMLLCNYCQSHCHQPGERLGAGLSQNPGSEFPCTSPATRSHPFLYEDLGQSSRLAMVVWDKPIHQQGQPGSAGLLPWDCWISSGQSRCSRGSAHRTHMWEQILHFETCYSSPAIPKVPADDQFSC